MTLLRNHIHSMSTLLPFVVNMFTNFKLTPLFKTILLLHFTELWKFLQIHNLCQLQPLKHVCIYIYTYICNAVNMSSVCYLDINNTNYLMSTKQHCGAASREQCSCSIISVKLSVSIRHNPCIIIELHRLYLC